LLLVLALLAAAPEYADPGVRLLEVCRVETVSFRTPTDGWLTDACGQVFRSSDGGMGWVRSPASSGQGRAARLPERRASTPGDAARYALAARSYEREASACTRS